MTKDYRGVYAVKSVDFTLKKGEIHALLGENGAGKSTLTKIIAGAVAPSSGEMLIDGAPTSFAAPKDALAAGIVMVYQENSLVPALTVAQNIYVGRERFYNRLRGINIAAQQLMQSLNFNVDPTATVATLGAAQKQMVEIARAVSQNARVVIFDEPTATLTPEEKHHFFGLMRRLKQSGVAIIFISHALEEALNYADRITVLRDGEMVTNGRTDAFDRDSIIRAMVGRTLSKDIYGTAAEERSIRKPGKKVLSVSNLSMANLVKSNSFSVFGGQVTGIFGLIGSGRTETAKIIAGVLKRDFFHGGEVHFHDQSVRYITPQPAVRDGIVYVTEDRKLEGFFEAMSIGENIGMGDQAINGGPLSVYSMVRVRRLAGEWIKSLNIRAINEDAKVIELSGGNQQKVVIAKSLVQHPKLIIFDEPTRGVDVGAIVEIHNFINSLADAGLAVVVISSYLPEILAISDRVLVMRNGRIVEEFDGETTTEEKIMYAAVH